MTDAYRGVDAILEDRLARFRERRALEGAAGEVAARVLAVREGRIAGGAVGAAIAVAMFLTSVVGVTHDRNAEIATFLLPAGWMGAAGAMAVVRARALARATRALGSEPLLTGDAPADLALIGATDPLGELRARAVARETRSVAYPLAALSLLAPLTIHGAISLVAFIATGADQWARGFGVWIASSAVLVGLAHAALALQVVLWARSLRRRETAMLRDKLHKAWSMALLITSGVALVPGIFIAGESELGLLVTIPPTIVFLTGASFLPFAYLCTARHLERERAALDGTPLA
jgi:hypothetical protein